MKPVKETVGIIMPIYNASLTLDRAILSVLNQSHEHWKLYLINDGSNDNSLLIINKYLNDERIHLENMKCNKGVSHARNAGLKLVREDYVSFLDSDDEWLPQKLEKQIVFFKNGSDIVNSNYFFSKKNDIKSTFYHKDNLSIQDFLKKKQRICFSSLICKSEIIKNKEFKNYKHEDFLFIHDLLVDEGRVIDLCKEPLVVYYCTENSLSSNKVKASIWQVILLNEIFKKNKIKIIPYFLHYAINAFFFERRLKKC